MKTEQRNVTVGEVCAGYFNDAEEGVVGYDGRLDIRPKYQREFVYPTGETDLGHTTLGYPLETMHR